MNVWHDFISLFVPAADDHKTGFSSREACVAFPLIGVDCRARFYVKSSRLTVESSLRRFSRIRLLAQSVSHCCDQYDGFFLDSARHSPSSPSNLATLANKAVRPRQPNVVAAPSLGTKPAVKSIERVIHSKKVNSILAPAIFNTWL